MTRSLMPLFLTVVFLAAPAVAQNKPASPQGYAATQVGGAWSDGQRPQYQGGKWIEIHYNRPILRQRAGIFGEGESFGQRLNAGAPVWRAGANKSSRLVTEAPLVIGDKTVPAGEYSLFIELSASDDWTLIVSSHGAVDNFQDRNDSDLWGSYGYSDAKDVARAKMTVSNIDLSVDQLTWGFVNVTKTGGAIALWWDKSMAWVPFEVAE